MVKFHLPQNRGFFLPLFIAMLISISFSGCGNKEYLTKEERNAIELTIQKAKDVQKNSSEETLPNAQEVLKVIQDANPLIISCVAKVPSSNKGELEEQKKLWEKKVIQTTTVFTNSDMKSFYSLLGESIQQTIDIMQKIQEIDKKQW